LTFPPCEEFTTWYITEIVEARLSLVEVYRQAVIAFPVCAAESISTPNVRGNSRAL